MKWPCGCTELSLSFGGTLRLEPRVPLYSLDSTDPAEAEAGIQEL
jgi:hypothetical protein